jgi:ABC-type xylose transport system permease subunit
MIEWLGTICAVLGSIVSVVGALVNNLKHDHHRAMEWWMYSNILLLTWCVGNLAGLWNGGISVGAMMCMYLIFTVSNAWGLFHV